MAIRCSVNRRAAATLSLPPGHFYGSSNRPTRVSLSSSSWWDTHMSGNSNNNNDVSGKAPSSSSDPRKASLQKKWVAWLKSAGYDLPSSSSSSTSLSSHKPFFDSQTYDDSSITRPTTARTYPIKTQSQSLPQLSQLDESASAYASTSSLDPLADYEKHGLIPRSPLRLYQLVTCAYRARKHALISDILHTMAHNPAYKEVEVQALFAVLEMPVDLGKIRTHEVRTARREGRVIEENRISQTVFFETWTRLWTLHGEALSFHPQQAGHILQTLLHILSTTCTPSTRENNAAVSAKTLRHLLFLAGLDDNPILALDLLTYILYPHFLTLSIFKPLDTSALPPPSKTQKDDIPLILHDILRSGIIPSSVLKEFDLSAIVGRGASLSPERFSGILKQTLLRMLIRTYANRKRLDRATSCVKLLQAMDEGTSNTKSSGSPMSLSSIGQKKSQNKEERDVKLLRDVCVNALQASETSGQWVNRVSEILVNALLPSSSSLKQIWDLSSSLLLFPHAHAGSSSPDVHLLRLFFDTALPPSPPVVHHSRIRYTAAVLLWKALYATLGPGKIDEVVNLSMDQSIRILAFTSRKYTDENMQRFSNYFPSSSSSSCFSSYSASTSVRNNHQQQQNDQSMQRQDFIRMIRYIRERLFFTPCECTNKQANDILHILLTSTSTFTTDHDLKIETNKTKATVQLYETFVEQSIRLADGPFYLQRRNLVLLVKAVNSLSNASSQGGEKGGLSPRVQAERIIQRFIDDRRDTSRSEHRLARDDLNIVLRAFLANNDRDAALRVLSEIVKAAQVPSLEDVEAILEDVLGADAELGLSVLENCLQAGLRLDRRAWEKFGSMLEGQDKKYRKILLDLKRQSRCKLSRQQAKSEYRATIPPNPYCSARFRAKASKSGMSPMIDTASDTRNRSSPKQHVQA